jgi:beta-phosphoglucomutase
LGITDYFQSIIGGEDVEKGKPDPEVFLKAAAGLGVAPEDCVVFEDSAAGAEAALRAGMRCIIVNATTDWGGVFGDDSHVLHRARDYFDLKLQEEGNGA